MREELKHLAELVTGIARPRARDVVPRSRKPHLHHLKDDGKTPNNPYLPFIHYKSVVPLDARFDPAAVFDVLFAANGWKHSWRDGIYPFLHFHTHTHEVLGIARGHAQVLFGGRKGIIKELRAGDVVINPAGTGHKRLSASKDLLVVGAYPAKRGGGKYNEPRPEEVDIEAARKEIARVGIPARDPVFGAKDGLKKVWRK